MPMEDKRVRITKQVIDAKTNTGVPALRVEACDKDSIVKRSLQNCRHRSRRRLRVRIQEGRLKDL